MDNVKVYYEKLLDLLDWGRVAAFVGPISFISCIILGLVTLFNGAPDVSSLVCIYTILVGGLIGLWEYPSLYTLCHEKDIGPLGKVDINAIRARFWDDFKIKTSYVRSVFYGNLAFYPLFTVSGLCFYSGIVLLVNSICLILSHLSEARYCTKLNIFICMYVA